MFTPVALNVLLTRATLKGLALANFMFVYLSFGLCLCRDGLYEFDLSKDEKSSFVCDGVSCPNMTG